MKGDRSLIRLSQLPDEASYLNSVCLQEKGVGGREGEREKRREGGGEEEPKNKTPEKSTAFLFSF
jgi:hypothetical protein